MWRNIVDGSVLNATYTFTTRYRSLISHFRILGRSIPQWLVRSRLLVSLLVVRPRASSWQPRQPERAPHLQVVLRSHIGTGLELWHSGRFADTRSQLSCSSGNCRSSVLSGKLLKISRQICDSRVLPLVHFRKPVRPTWSDSLKTLTCAQSTRNGSQSCRRTSSWLDGSGESEHNPQYRY
ncbi:hypothetical protein NP493_453g03000 [Ridgeia piscesae]|uniref:Uncharacterized protein n=1 Tax=Ridgeia piscesae TaxID=27915 RepID=A0AAD9KZ34_RIDPI|nr:hypothetical protein NP493_453g03000 [Ridgeia piscesae]